VNLQCKLSLTGVSVATEVSLSTSGNLPAGIIDTYGKFATSIAAINVNLRKDVTTGGVDAGGAP
jgi:hypothetical protein